MNTKAQVRAIARGYRGCGLPLPLRYRIAKAMVQGKFGQDILALFVRAGYKLEYPTGPHERCTCDHWYVNAAIVATKGSHRLEFDQSCCGPSFWPESSIVYGPVPEHGW